MTLDDCYQLGRVIKTHGLSGEVTIFLDVDSPPSYKNIDSLLLLKNDKLIPFFVESIQINSNNALVKFDDIENVEDASELVKLEVYLPLSQLPKLPHGKYYFHELIGCQVIEKGNIIGKVNEIIDLKGNELLSVDYKGKEVLIPIKNQILDEIMLEEKKIHVTLPSGLLDL